MLKEWKICVSIHFLIYVFFLSRKPMVMIDTVDVWCGFKRVIRQHPFEYIAVNYSMEFIFLIWNAFSKTLYFFKSLTHLGHIYHLSTQTNTRRDILHLYDHMTPDIDSFHTDWNMSSHIYQRDTLQIKYTKEVLNACSFKKNRVLWIYYVYISKCFSIHEPPTKQNHFWVQMNYIVIKCPT